MTVQFYPELELDKSNLKTKAPRNRTIELSDKEKKKFSERLIKVSENSDLNFILNKTINQDLFKTIEFLPEQFVDLLFIDPPYNMNKKFNSVTFTQKSIDDYAEWLESFIQPLLKILKPDATVYICGDWRSSVSVQLVMNKYFKLINRITWEREKGRGSKNNWKNNSEDIWFYAFGNKYLFNHENVKLKRRVLAPYKNEEGIPKDWQSDDNGNFRLTYPSNIWTDISVPFWSMPENTIHPTQKPEKLLAKIILASSNEGDVIFDPFLGSGTTSVTAKKLNRNFVGVELDTEFALIAEKRLELAKKENSIQGYGDKVFWERNTIPKGKTMH